MSSFEFFQFLAENVEMHVLALFQAFRGCQAVMRTIIADAEVEVEKARIQNLFTFCILLTGSQNHACPIDPVDIGISDADEFQCILGGKVVRDRPANIELSLGFGMWGKQFPILTAVCMAYPPQRIEPANQRANRVNGAAPNTKEHAGPITRLGKINTRAIQREFVQQSRS